MNGSEKFVLHHGETVEKENAGAVNMEGFEGGYMTYKDSIVDVRERQIASPTNPDKPFARDLRIEVIDMLGLENPEEMDNVAFFSALGTSFDVYHGIDCFLEVATEEGKKMVTIDITTREKLDFKADILVVFPKDNLDPNLDESEYLGIIEKVAKAIVEKLENPSSGQIVIYQNMEGNHE